MLKLPSNALSQGALAIVKRLREAGFSSLLAGGCVRDMLMDQAPKDYDIATDAIPEKVLELFPKSIAVGKAFGVVRVQLNDNDYEVATFRKDSVYKDGRHPVAVSFTDEKTDAWRRDFTINAIFFDPLDGSVHDHVGGQADIQKKIIRTVGDPQARFAEDHLRLLRAARFSAVLDCSIEPATFEAIRNNAQTLKDISAERIQQELTRILLESKRAGDAIELLRQLDLLKVILPEVEAMRGQAQPPQFHPEGDVYTHTIIMLNALHAPSLQLAYAVLFHDVGKPKTAYAAEDRLRFHGHAALGATMAEETMKRLRMPSDDIKAVTFAIDNHMRFMEVRKMRRSTLHRLVGAPTFPVELELHRLDCAASHGDLQNYEFLVNFIKELQSQPALPKHLINGNDLLALGIPAGRDIGKWKKLAYDAQLEGEFKEREAALQWLKKQLASAGSKQE